MAVRIEKLVANGLGLAHVDGRTALIGNSLPGESVVTSALMEEKGVLRGDAVDILEPSPLRISPICPYYGICGGCDFQIVSEKSSAELKEEIVKDNLSRIAHLETLPEFLSPVYGNAHGYRSRARFHVDLRTKKHGFLASRSNSIVEIESCPVLNKDLAALLSGKDSRLFQAARSAMFENRMSRTGFAEVAAFAGDDDISLSDKAVRITAGTIPYYVSSRVFFQSNPVLLPKLLEFVKENAVGDEIMDLYSGVGTFSAAFEGSGKKVWAVEKQRECLILSKKNAPSANSFTGDVAEWGRKMGRRVSTVIVDPPRVGLGDGVPEMISSWSPERIIYVSCNSVTLARDLPHFKDYSIDKVRVFDFYPGTSHVETVAVMSRIAEDGLK